MYVYVYVFIYKLYSEYALVWSEEPPANAPMSRAGSRPFSQNTRGLLFLLCFSQVWS